MSKKITLSEVKEKLDYNRSVSSQANLLKYVAVFLDQKEIRYSIVEKVLGNLERAKDKGYSISEVLVGQAFTKEINTLLEGSTFWDPIPKLRKHSISLQILGMAPETNALLKYALTKQIDVSAHVDKVAFGELTGLTELTPGQIWNLKMKKARENKRLEREQAAHEQVSVISHKGEKVENHIESKSDDPFEELAKHMTPEELAELRELNDLKF